MSEIVVQDLPDEFCDVDGDKFHYIGVALDFGQGSALDRILPVR